MYNSFFLSICGAAAGFAFVQLRSFLGSLLTGAGHGTVFFIYLFTSPPPENGLIIWPLVGALIPMSRFIAMKVLMVTLLMADYFSILALFFDREGLGEIVSVTKRAWFFVAPVSGFYIRGVRLWVRLVS